MFSHATEANAVIYPSLQEVVTFRPFSLRLFSFRFQFCREILRWLLDLQRLISSEAQNFNFSCFSIILASFNSLHGWAYNLLLGHHFSAKIVCH